MSFTPIDSDRVDQIVDSLAALLQRRSIAREIENLKRFVIEPEPIDEQLLAALDASFSLEDERLAADIPQLNIKTAPSGAPEAA